MTRQHIRPDDSVCVLKGVGEKKALLLERLGVRTVDDLLHFFPRRYEDRRQMAALKDLIPGGPPLPLRARVVTVEERPGYGARAKHITRACLSDESGVVWAVWFNRRGLARVLVPGTELALFGALKQQPGSPELYNPEIEFLSDGAVSRTTGCIVPVYPSTEGLNERSVAKLIAGVLDTLPNAVSDVLPRFISEKYGFADADSALREMHCPTDEQKFKAARARMIFEEFFLLQIGLALRRRRGVLEKTAPAFNAPPNVQARFLASLQFDLTDDQKRVVEEISADLKRSVPMNRLLQGDVGSGKTVVALMALLQALDSGYQAALMAPTGVLAEQHALTLRKWLAPLGVDVGLLTGGLPAAARKAVLSGLSDGSLRLVVGTHALIQDTVKFKNLGLAIIDEQHRFGVLQRRALSSKAEKGAYSPHILVMTATPIPRTLLLLVYGDLAVSVIRQLPKGRQPIRTVCIGESRVPRMEDFLDREMAQGHRVYWVCPLIEESDAFDASPLELRYEQLRARFPNRRVGMLHGRMSERDKTSVMGDFASGKIDLLAATTVVEVGMDVPEATVIVIENAERFGLSQLHQLRGRVGRGPYQSWCVLYAQPKSRDARERLLQFCRLSDGFAIAEADMALRGPGEVCGVRQHGLTDFRVADLSRDSGVMKTARAEAFSLVKSCANPYSEYPELMSAVMGRYGRLLDIAGTA